MKFPRNFPRHQIAVIGITLLLFCWAGFDVLHETGMVGVTMRGPEPYGCICHGSNMPTDTILVFITGAETVATGSSHVYTITMLGGPSVAGGFNLVAGRGSVSPNDTTSTLAMNSRSEFELTHAYPKPFSEGKVSWEFLYHAPEVFGSDTIYSVGNSVNRDIWPTEDEFNFGIDYYITVVDSVLGVADEQQPVSFTLHQNFPNPFNPATTISYSLTEQSRVKLNIYDALGRLIETLVDARQEPGIHNVNFSPANLPSGIYIYQVQTVAGTITKKMLYIR